MTMRVSKDRIDMDDKVLQKPVIKDYGESVVSANSSTAYTIDLTQGNVFYITLTGNCAFTFSNPPASGTAGSFTLFLIQDSTGSRTATWPAAVSWLGGSAPTLTTTSVYADVLVFMTVNGGTTWYGAVSAKNYYAYVWTGVYIPYGYFGGGYGPLSSVSRVDYSNDTATAAVKGPLSSARYSPAATGSSSYGYFGAGSNFPSAFSRVDRIDYANDTAAAVAKGPLSLARYYLSAAGNSSYGYFGGGYSPLISRIDRIDYANDTATAAIKGPLSVARSQLAATGNSSYGYFGAGALPSFASRVDRVDYASDASTAAAKGPLSVARTYLAATSSSSYGYFGGGQFSTTLIDRVDYTNDTATAIAKGPLSVARLLLAATSSSFYGYFGAGLAPGLSSSVDRFDYSNDTATAALKGLLPATNAGLGGTNHNPL